jgi:thioredoxin reductase (NADPH)
LCAGKEIALVGGGNSAGQAIVFLAPHVKRLHVFVRRELSETMSRYLIDRISALPNVDIHVGTDLIGLAPHGETLASATVRDRASAALTQYEICHLFLFIGATPHTCWLNGSLAMDDKGFILTGGSTSSLETSMPESLPSATSERARLSEWPPQSAMGLPPFHRSTITSASRPRRRRENL